MIQTEKEMNERLEERIRQHSEEVKTLTTFYEKKMNEMEDKLEKTREEKVSHKLVNFMFLSLLIDDH